MSATTPEPAAALHARPGCGGDDGKRRARFGVFFSAGAAVSALIVVAVRASHSAPAAASAFKATPMSVVPRTPTAGISQKPAAITPAAAPAVLAEYSAPTSAAIAVFSDTSPDTVRLKADPTALVFWAKHRAAIGNVAPMAAAGMRTSTRLSARRTAAKRAGAVPSAYAHASAGTHAASSAGSASAS